MVVSFMKFRNSRKSNINTKKILNQVSKCKNEELENLLKQIEIIIQKSKEDDIDLLMAKTIITSRLASIRS